MSEQQDKVFMYYREKSLYHDNLEGEERQCELCKPIWLLLRNNVVTINLKS